MSIGRYILTYSEITFQSGSTVRPYRCKYSNSAWVALASRVLYRDRAIRWDYQEGFNGAWDGVGNCARQTWEI